MCFRRRDSCALKRKYLWAATYRNGLSWILSHAIMTLESRVITVIMACDKIKLGPFLYVATHMWWGRRRNEKDRSAGRISEVWNRRARRVLILHNTYTHISSFHNPVWYSHLFPRAASLLPLPSRGKYVETQNLFIRPCLQRGPSSDNTFADASGLRKRSTITALFITLGSRTHETGGVFLLSEL